MRRIPGWALALICQNCGDYDLQLQNLVGEWAYDACTWGAEGSRQIPCEEFRPLGTVEFGSDSSITYWLTGRQAFRKGRITRMEFQGRGGILAGRAEGDPRDVEAEIRLQEGKLVYTLRFTGGSAGELRGMAEHGILRRK